MSPARAPGAVKARDCLLSSWSHAPGSRSRLADESHSSGRGLAEKRASPTGGVCGARVEKEECCQSLGQIGSWSKQARSRKTWTPKSLSASAIATRSPREGHESSALSTSVYIFFSSSLSVRLRCCKSHLSVGLSPHRPRWRLPPSPPRNWRRTHAHLY